MTVFGHPVLFGCLEKREKTASPKTPMQWHTTRTLSLDNAVGQQRQLKVGVCQSTFTALPSRPTKSTKIKSFSEMDLIVKGKL